MLRRMLHISYSPFPKHKSNVILPLLEPENSFEILTQTSHCRNGKNKTGLVDFVQSLVSKFLKFLKGEAILSFLSTDFITIVIKVLFV